LTAMLAGQVRHGNPSAGRLPEPDGGVGDRGRAQVATSAVLPSAQ
jgi:hypothetical protein